MAKDSEAGKWKWFFGLAYLPPEKFDEGFVDLLTAAPIEAE